MMQAAEPPPSESAASSGGGASEAAAATTPTRERLEAVCTDDHDRTNQAAELLAARYSPTAASPGRGR